MQGLFQDLITNLLNRLSKYHTIYIVNKKIFYKICFFLEFTIADDTYSFEEYNYFKIFMEHYCTSDLHTNKGKWNEINFNLK